LFVRQSGKALCLLFLMLIAGADASARKTVAVVADFRASGVAQDVAQTVANTLRAELTRIRRFVVVQRGDMEAIARDLQSEVDHCTDQGCAVELGRMLNAEKVVVGRVARLLGRLVITAQIVDLGRNDIEFARTLDCADEPEAVRNAAARVARDLSKQVPLVIEVLGIERDGHVLDAGAADGLQRGQTLEMLRAHVVRDVRGRPLLEEMRPAGRLKIVETAGDKSRARQLSGEVEIGDIARVHAPGDRVDRVEDPAEPPASASTPPPSTYTDFVTGVEFVFVKGGTFAMGDTFGKGWLGLDLERGRGIDRTRVVRVLPGGPADQAGIRAGAHLISVNGEAADRASHLLGVVQQYLPGTTVRITAYQDGEKQNLDVLLQEWPPSDLKTGVRRGQRVHTAITMNYAKGTREERDDERPVHEVTVCGFYFGKTEVTQAQWEKVMGPGSGRWKNQGADLPAYGQSAERVQEFIDKLNEKSGESYRLPTEAEWEYAARSGGKHERWPGTSRGSELQAFAWFGANSAGKPHPVGQKTPNALGLFDLAGNVSELCSDWYFRHYYDESPAQNPTGPESRSRAAIGEGGHVHRGGDAKSSAWGCRTAKRDTDWGSGYEDLLGVRLVREVR
jgi:formylglycine-generating enzyme required for sulfatase activity/TolB-like protein